MAVQRGGVRSECYVDVRIVNLRRLLDSYSTDCDVKVEVGLGMYHSMSSTDSMVRRVWD